MTQIIKSLEELKALASNGPIECTIALNDFAKTQTTIDYCADGFSPWDRTDIKSYQWDVFQGSGDCYLEIEDDTELEEMTSIVLAIKRGRLRLDWPRDPIDEKS